MTTNPALLDVQRLARIEALLARPFADEREVLDSEGADAASLVALRAHVSILLTGPDADEARRMFSEAWADARAGRPSPPPRGPSRPEVPSATDGDGSSPPPGLDDPSPLEAKDVLRPSYLLARAELPGADETAYLAAAPSPVSLPFRAGDGRAFAAAAPRLPAAPHPGADATLPIPAPPAGSPSAAAATGNPFELPIERSLAAFVDFIVTTIESPGEASAIASRFGVHSAVDRERIVATWRARWDRDPALRTEWRQLYDERRRRGGARSG